MHYVLVYYPQLESSLADSIRQIRRKYDPTVRLIRPHVTIMFPTPASVGELQLISHLHSVLTDWSPFEIRFGGFLRSHDHWLFLGLATGAAPLKRLYRDVGTGILAEYVGDYEYEPHLGLGLFIKEGSRYDMVQSQEADFDRQRYDKALREATALSLDASYVVEKLHMVKLPHEVMDWVTGQRASIPGDSRTAVARVLRLG